MLKSKVSAGKRPSTMKLRSKQSNLSQGIGLRVSHGDVPSPKTRFSLNDGPCSSPRLKSFPAELIKRTSPPPAKNPEGNTEMAHQLKNSGQGDTLVQQSGLKSHCLPHSLTVPNENISSMSEQQVPHAICPVNQQVNQSELAISSPTGIASHERPPHRPHVPHTNATLRDPSPKKPFSPQLTRPLQNIHQAQVPVGPGEKRPNQYQNRDPRCMGNDSIRPPAPENMSVEDSDRYPGFFRRAVTKNENVNIGTPVPQRFIAAQNVSNVCPVADGKPVDFAQPQQIYHGQQANAQHYQNNNVHSGMLRRQLIESNPIMKSPQDVATNQNENWQLNSQSQNPWAQNNGPQLQSYATNTLMAGNVNPIASECYQNVKETEIQAGPNQHNTLQGYSQEQQQSYGQKNLTTGQTRSPPQANLKTSGGDHHQTTEDDKKKVLKFTPAMIKDQEMLVTTMRQQRIPEDIMRRQFDALLVEQRKQLLYIEQLERTKTESNNSKTAPQGRRVQRKISKIEEDGKPEWMVHITPPRIPYHVIEKMRTEREVVSQSSQIPGNSVSARPPDDQQHSHGRIAQRNCNQPWQHNGHTVWQQPSQYQPISHDCSITDVPNQQQTWKPPDMVQTHQIFHGQQENIQHYHNNNVQSGMLRRQLVESNPGMKSPQDVAMTQNQNWQQPMQLNSQSQNGHNGGQANHYGFPVQYQHYMQQVPQQMGQSGVNHAREEIQHLQRYQQPDKSLEPSSLLKLRLYKEVIRKQKQNNGLQDPETVREAMEALKNPANRKGLEYLDNLNKKHEKPVSLNGAQDTQDHGFSINGSPPDQYLCKPTKMPSANGLENRRNPNKPTTASLLHEKQAKDSRWSEYPPQKVKSPSHECYSFVAEKENGTVAPTDCHKSYPVMPQGLMMHNPMPVYPESKLDNGGEVPGHLQQQSIVYNHGKALADGSSSMPHTFTQQNQNQYHAAQMHQFHGNSNGYFQPNGPNGQSYMVPQPGGVIFKGNGNVQQQFSNKKTEIQEIIMPGGLKYLARKPEYIPRSSAPPYQQNVHSGKYFGPPIPCQ